MPQSSALDVSPIDDVTPYNAPRPAAVSLTPVCRCQGGTLSCHPTEIHCTSCARDRPVDCYRAGTPANATGRCAECRAARRRCGVCRLPWAVGPGDATTDTPRCACAPETRTGYHGWRSDPATSVALGALRGESLPLDDEDEAFVGYEIETMPRPDGPSPLWGEILHRARSLLLGVETDSSLAADGPDGRRLSGAEIITRPMPLDVWRDSLADLYRVIGERATAAHRVCGGHIHVSALPHLVDGARKVCATYDRPEQQRVWTAVCGRPLGGYCERTGGHLSVERTALWRCDRLGTLEWRQPAGTDDPRVALGRAELLISALDHAAHTDGPWGWGRYLRDHPAPTPETRYAWALLRSLGF